MSQELPIRSTFAAIGLSLTGPATYEHLFLHLFVRQCSIVQTFLVATQFFGTRRSSALSLKRCAVPEKAWQRGTQGCCPPFRNRTCHGFSASRGRSTNFASSSQH